MGEDRKIKEGCAENAIIWIILEVSVSRPRVSTVAASVTSGPEPCSSSSWHGSTLLVGRKRS